MGRVLKKWKLEGIKFHRHKNWIFEDLWNAAVSWAIVGIDCLIEGAFFFMLDWKMKQLEIKTSTLF